MSGTALRTAPTRSGTDGLFAVVANFGTTNVGAVDGLDAIADACGELDLWLHVDAAYGGAALCAPRPRDARGFQPADSFGVDPHKWLFAPYDCAALVYREPALALRRTPRRHVPRHGQPGRVEPERLRLPPLPAGPRAPAVVQPGHVRHGSLHGGGRENDARRGSSVRRRGRSPRRLRAAARTAAVGRAVHRRRLGRGALPWAGASPGPGPVWP